MSYLSKKEGLLSGFRLSRRLLIYVGLLSAIVVLGTLGAKLHKILVLAHQHADHAFSLIDVFTLLSSDLFVLSLWVLFWFWVLHAARGKFGSALAVLFQLSTVVIMLFIVIEHGFALVTGSMLDWNLLRYTAEHFERLQAVIFSEMGLASWLGLALAVVVAVLPALLLRGLSVERRGAPLSMASIVALVLTPLLLGALHFTLSSHKLPAVLQPLRGDAMYEAVRDAFVDLIGDHGVPSGVRALHPMEPLVVARSKETKPYNVALIVLESVRADVLTPYSSKRTTTPFLASLARRGTLAEHAYTVIPHTTKSLIPLHCGIYPKITPHFDEASEGGMPSDCLAKVLRRMGYATHFIQSPESVFERRRDLVNAFGFERLSAKEQLPTKDFQKVGYFGFEDDIMIAPTLKWIDEVKGKGRPFFLGMLTVVTHHPYQVPRDFKTPKWPVKGKIARYFNSLSYMDRFLKRLFKGFEDRGLLDNTVFILVGDHGEGFGEHGRWAHDQILHEEGIRVPLIFLGADVPKGVRLKGMWQHIDVVPTVLDLLKLKVVAGALPGKSLLKGKGHDRLYYSCWRDDRCAAIRQGDIKTIDYFGKRDPEVFDLSKDPKEKHDLVASGEVKSATLKPRLTALAAWKEEVNSRFQAQSTRRKHPFVTDSEPEDLGTPVNITFDRFARLIGYKFDRDEIADGEAVWVTTYYEVLQDPKPGWKLWMHANGPRVRGRGHNLVNDHIPVEGSYPVDEWKEGQYVTDRHWLRVRPGYPSGDYEVTFGFYRKKGGTRASPHGEGLPLTASNAVYLGTIKVVNPLHPAEDPYKLLAPETRRKVLTRPPLNLPGAVTAVFGDSLALIGVRPGRPSVLAGQSTVWTWTLKVLKTPSRWTDIFVHVEGPLKGEGFADGKRSYINAVHRPLGKGPDVGKWAPGWTIVDEHKIKIPKHFRPGRYRILMGFWDPNLDTIDHRLSIDTRGEVRKNRLVVGTFTVRSPSPTPSPTPSSTPSPSGGRP